MIMATYTDIHQHFLYGMDDGVKSIHDMRRMIDAAYRSGVRTMYATPHVSPGRRAFNWDDYAERLNRAQVYCDKKNYRLNIIGGAEIFYTPATIRLLNEGRIPMMGNSRYVLVEWNIATEFSSIFKDIRDISNAGYTVIVAHIERYQSMWLRIQEIRRLKQDFGIRIQVNCDALLDKRSFFMKHFLNRLIREDLVDYVASDAHGTRYRKIRMAEADCYIRKKYGKNKAYALLHGNQQELVVDKK